MPSHLNYTFKQSRRICYIDYITDKNIVTNDILPSVALLVSAGVFSYDTVVETELPHISVNNVQTRQVLY